MLFISSKLFTLCHAGQDLLARMTRSVSKMCVFGVILARIFQFLSSDEVLFRTSFSRLFVEIARNLQNNIAKKNGSEKHSNGCISTCTFFSIKNDGLKFLTRASMYKSPILLSRCFP